MITIEFFRPVFYFTKYLPVANSFKLNQLFIYNFIISFKFTVHIASFINIEPYSK